MVQARLPVSSSYTINTKQTVLNEIHRFRTVFCMEDLLRRNKERQNIFAFLWYNSNRAPALQPVQITVFKNYDHTGIEHAWKHLSFSFLSSC